MRHFLSSFLAVIVLGACGMVTGVDQDYTFDLPGDAGVGTRDSAARDSAARDSATDVDAGRDAGMCPEPSPKPPSVQGSSITPKCWMCLTVKCGCEVYDCTNNSQCARLLACANDTKQSSLPGCEQNVTASLRRCLVDGCSTDCFQPGN
jgi:hypothetical protein